MGDGRERMRRPSAVSDLLAAVFRGKPAEMRLKESGIWQIWDVAVGKQIASRARPASVRDGVLVVDVASSSWMQQLNFLKKGIIENLNARLGENLIHDIRLRAGKTEPPAPREKRQVKKRPLSPEETRVIEEAAAALEDHELREAFAELLAKHLQSRSPEL